jgi:hypothetical protein
VFRHIPPSNVLLSQERFLYIVSKLIQICKQKGFGKGKNSPIA